MNWLNLLTLILQAAETDLPLIEQIIDGVHTATPAKLRTLNIAVASALKPL